MATVLVDESFNGASSNTNLEDFTLNNVWSRVGGAANGWVVQSTDLLRCNPQTGKGYILDGTSNQGGFVEFTLPSPFVDDGGVFVALRIQDADNFYGLKVAGEGYVGARFTSVIGGVEDETLHQFQAVSAETYRIEDDGAELRLYSGSVNGEGGTLLHTEVTSTLSTAVGKGFVNASGLSSSPQWDYYKSGVLGDQIPDSISTDNEPSQKVWQRTQSNNASVTITGTYSGTPTSIERSVDGGAFVTAVTSPSSEVFSDTFTLATGEHDITYRFGNDIAVTTTLTPVVVGEVFVCAGQSNMSGRGNSNQTFSNSAGGVTAYMLGNDDNFKVLQDPYDSDTNQVDAVSSDPTASGSWIVRFANQWLANNEIPPIFIPCAKGGTAISEWARSTSATTLYGSMKRRVDLVGGCAVVLWEQGERDSTNAVNTSGAAYQAALEQLALDIDSDFGVKTFVIPLHTLTATGYDNQTAIRAAQIDAAAASANIEISQTLTDIDLSSGDGLHFQTYADLDLVATRVYQSYTAVTSTLNISIAGIPDGIYKTYLEDQLRVELFKSDLSFTGGNAIVPSLPVAVGTELEGHVIDNEKPHVNGAVITGVTV